MSPVGPPTAPARTLSLITTHRPLLLATVAVLALVATLALTLTGGGSAGAETVSILPSAASCSNSSETDDTPRACSASAGMLAPGGGSAIVETDNAGTGQGDDDLQVVFSLGGVDPGRVIGASLQVGSSQSGAAGTIQLGGPQISDTNYGSVPATGGSTSNGALRNAVTAAAGGSLTVWLQVACNGSSNDCGANVDSVRLNVELEDLTPSVSLLVSDSANRSGAQALAGADLDGNTYVFVGPAGGINQVRFFLDDPGRTSPVQIENQGPFDFAGTSGGSANPWNTDSVATGSHTIAAEVNFSNGTSTVLNATFNTGDPAPTPGNPALLVSGSPNRSNSQALNGANLTATAYIHVSPSDGINRVRFFLDDPALNSADKVENNPPFDFGGTNGNGSAAAWNPGSVSSGAHTMHAEVRFSNGTTSILSANFTTGGGATPTPTPSPTPTATPPPPSNQDVFVSTSSNRSNPAVLDGQSFNQNIFVFVLTGDGVQQARFWLDDRDRSGPADRVENIFPFDFAGGSPSQAGALRAGDLSEGTHWITVELDIAGAGTQVVEGSFTVPGGGGGGGTTVPPGAIRINPGQSIQNAVNSNPAGSVFVLGSGVHRMQTVVPKNNNQFYGEPGAIMNGSRILTNWTNAGGGDYYVGGQTQQTTRKGGCQFLPDGTRLISCKYAEQVFVNGTPLAQVFSRGELNGSNFYFDYDANRIYIGQNPGGKFIETSVQQHAFNGGGTGVIIDGIIIEKYSTRAQQGAIHPARGWTIRNNEVRYIHGTGIRISTDSRILDNHVHHNGQLGIGGVGNNVLIQGNEVSFNNTERFLVDWEGGGIKVAVSRDVTFRDNYVHRNDGRGIWTDLDVVDALVEDNLVEWNNHEGIKHEISWDAIIRDNLVRFNGTKFAVQLWGAQILLQNSQNVEVYNNEVWVSSQGGDGIGMVQQNRGSGALGPWLSRNNNVHHNEIHHQATKGNNGLAGGCQASANNRFNFNTYYAPSAYFTTAALFEMCGPKRTWSQFLAGGWEANGVAIPTD